MSFWVGQICFRPSTEESKGRGFLPGLAVSARDPLRAGLEVEFCAQLDAARNVIAGDGPERRAIVQVRIDGVEIGVVECVEEFSPKLKPALSESELTAELIPLSHTLSRVATIGLKAMDALRTHRMGDATERQKDVDVLKAAEKPEAILRLMIVPSIEELVRAAGGQS